MRFRRTMSSVAVLAGLIAAQALTPSQASAQNPPLTVGDQPAATLLLPYFEVDLKNPGGANTFVTLNNASATATMVHVTVWSEMHVPVYGFDVYLTGYDVQPISVRDIMNGVLPRTASAGQDPGNLISPKGPLSQDINFASCTGSLPIPAPAPATIAHLRAALTGTASPVNGQCATRSNNTPTIARGYITMDVTNQCTSQFPGDAWLFHQRWRRRRRQSQRDLGRLRPDESPERPRRRRRLAARPHHRERDRPGVDRAGPIHVLRTPHQLQRRRQSRAALHHLHDALRQRPRQRLPADAAHGVARQQGPAGLLRLRHDAAWYPLKQKQIIFFDEQERPVKLTTLPLSDTPTPFPAGTQRVQVGSAKLPSAFATGTVYLNLMTAIAGNSNPPDDLTFETTQAWVTVHQKGAGRYSIGYPAVAARQREERPDDRRTGSVAPLAATPRDTALPIDLQRAGASPSARFPSIGTVSSGTCLLVVASRSVPLNAPPGIAGGSLTSTRQ